MIDYLFPASFLPLVLAHFAALISPGPDFFLIVGHGVRHRFRGAAFICAGIAAGNAIYIAGVVMGWSGLRHYPDLYRWLEIAGGAYLLWMGASLWRAGARSSSCHAAKVAAQPLSFGEQFTVGLGSALLNPKNVVFYLTLMTSIIGPDATLLQQSVAGIWMVMAVLFWDLALAGLLSHAKAQRIFESRIPIIERLSGACLIVIAVLFLATPLIVRETF